jgi:LPXTG-site transpeptidase (sortase) family protein
MKARNIVIGIIVLGLVWVVVFFVANNVVNNIDNEAELEAVPSPTPRPTREDVPELTASEEATQDAIVEAVTEEATEVAQIATEAPTEAPTERPTAAFTLQALEIASFQARQQDELEAELAALEAQRPVGGEEEFLGTYPIRLAIEDLGLISPVLQVQTDANFDIVTPRDEIGHYVLSERLGTGGNTVMVGHVYPGRVFNVLLDAEIGQVVRVTDENFEEHYYQITEIIRFPYEIGNAEDRELGLQYMHDNSEERLTLVTCYPEFEWTHRFVVRAVPIDGPPEPVEGDDDSGELPPIDFDLDN